MLIMTGGADDAIGDISAQAAQEAARIVHPNRRVALIFNVFGQSSHYAAIKRLAGDRRAAFQITDPAEINKIFFAAVGRDLATGPTGCASRRDLPWQQSPASPWARLQPARLPRRIRSK